MARITVEDCLDKVDNRFQLVLMATKRARQIALGSEPLVEFENDKPTVLALREIADGLVTRSILDEEPVLELDEDMQQIESEDDLDAALAAALESQGMVAGVSEEVSRNIIMDSETQDEDTDAGSDFTEEDAQ